MGFRAFLVMDNKVARQVMAENGGKWISACFPSWSSRWSCRQWSKWSKMGCRGYLVENGFPRSILHSPTTCKDSVNLRSLLRGFGDCGVIPRGSLGRKINEKIDCANWSDIIKGSMINGYGSVCISSVEYHGSESLGKEGRTVRKS